MTSVGAIRGIGGQTDRDEGRKDCRARTARSSIRGEPRGDEGDYTGTVGGYGSYERII